MFKTKQNRRTNKKGGIQNRGVIGTKDSIILNPKSTKLCIDCAYDGGIYAYGTSGDYSFSSSADVRYLLFSTITAGTVFTDASALYKNFKILSASVMVAPYRNSTAVIGILGVSCDPNVLSSLIVNPTNNLAYVAPNTKYIAPNSNKVERCTFGWKGIGDGQNLMFNTLIAPYGAFFISNSGDSYATSSIRLYDAIFTLRVEFSDVY